MTSTDTLFLLKVVIRLFVYFFKGGSHGFPLLFLLLLFSKLSKKQFS